MDAMDTSGRRTGPKRNGGSPTFFTVAIVIVIVLMLGIGAFMVMSPPKPAPGGNETPVPGHPELSLKPVSAFFPNGSQICVLENSKARDPVYGQMMSLVQDDPSVYEPYTLEHPCSYFSVALINNAERCYINAHLVILTLSNSSALHTVVAFNTTDEGWVFIDNTGLTQNEIDRNLLVAPRIANVVQGSTYTRHFIGFDIDENPGMGVVESITFLS